MATHPLVTPVQYVKGVGPKIAGLLAKLGVATVEDLLYFIPYRYLDRRTIERIADLTPGAQKCIVAQVKSSALIPLGRGRRRVYKVVLTDGSGEVSALWFYVNYPYLKSRFVTGRTFLLAGNVTEYKGKPQFIHPVADPLDGGLEANEEVGTIVPVYPATAGLWQKTLCHITRHAWEKYSSYLVDPVPAALASELKLQDLATSLADLHWPQSDVDAVRLNGQETEAHRRLIFQELFVLQGGLAVKRSRALKQAGYAIRERRTLVDKLLAGLPFQPTQAQQRVFAEIAHDLMTPHPMNRLLQGDVGSGKTLVALLASLLAVADGAQVAFMAPTEILAEQHFRTLKKYLGSLSVRTALLTSGTAPAAQKEWLTALQRGDVDIIVGTHALLEERVLFKDLRLIIIDEQHRFGVLQRARLKDKGMRQGVTPHVLVMTATPIPRTLAMTLYGDLDISVIDEMPPGRLPIVTRLLAEGEREPLYQFMEQQVSQGRQVFVVYPLVEESDKVDLKDATRMSAALQKRFAGRRVALLHGQMDHEAKEQVMGRFQRGEIDILVATTVIEVGIDVPNATVMVIEHAERFGLAQLHQLRGRIGRGGEASTCLLVAGDNGSEVSGQRLKVMAATQDGFRIADEDLKIRGPGEVMGTRQSGIPDLKFANLGRDTRLLSMARETAQQIVATDPPLIRPEHRGLKEMIFRQWGGRLKLIDVA